MTTATRSAPTDVVSRHRRLGVAGWISVAAVATFTATLYIVYSAWQWTQLSVRSWDLGIFTQALQGYASFGPPIVPIKGHEYNLLGDHFHPLLAVLAPVFALFPHAFTLLVIQALCFAGAAALITRTGIRVAGVAVATIIGLCFGLSFGLQYAAEAQFHEIALAVPLLAGSLCALVERRWIATAVWAAPLVFVKEDLGLTVFAIGLLLAFRSKQRLGIWLACWGVAWLALAVLVILPALNPGGEFAYGGSANPGSVLTDLGMLFHPKKGLTLLLLLGITGGLILRSPVALIMLPTLAWRFLSTNEGYFGPAWHYSAVLMPIAFVVVIDAMERAPRVRSKVLRIWNDFGWLPGLIVCAVMVPLLPLWSVVGPGAWTPPPRAEAAREALAAVPDGASVESDLGLMNFLLDDHVVTWIGSDNPPADCIMIDRHGGNTPEEWGDVIGVAGVLSPGIAYQVVYVRDGYELACTPQSLR